MGNGVFGAEAASHYWFNKKAKHLSQYEAAEGAYSQVLHLDPKDFHGNKMLGETTREWGEPIVMDPQVVEKIDALWEELGIDSNVDSKN